MPHDVMQAEADVLVIGAGAAGMYAAIEAARRGADVFLIDRSLIGRGGATVMAQMTVAVALGSEVPDHWSHHLDDTLAAGRGLCSESLSRLLCEEGPACILQMEEWGIGWARRDGRITQAMAPGHDRPRCVYVDFLNTGPAVSKTLRTVVNKTGGIRKAGGPSPSSPGRHTLTSLTSARGPHMDTFVGSGDFRYRVDPVWDHFPGDGPLGEAHSLISPVLGLKRPSCPRPELTYQIMPSGAISRRRTVVPPSGSLISVSAMLAGSIL